MSSSAAYFAVPRRSCVAVVTGLYCAASFPAQAQTGHFPPDVQKRFEAASTQLQYFAPADFVEGKGALASDASGRLGDVTLNAILQIPHVVSRSDAFIYALQYTRDEYTFSRLARDADSSVRDPALGDPPRAPYGPLEILRVAWTWKHSFSSGYHFYLHNRTGLHGEDPDWDTRFLRIGVASAIEWDLRANETLGGGVIGLWGIGGLQVVPFLRYSYLSPDLRIAVMLPLYARLYERASKHVEVGIVLEADGNRYRVQQTGLPFDNIDLIYSYWGPSVRVLLGEDVFLRADVGLSGLRVIDLYLDEELRSSLDVGQSPVSAIWLSWEPTYD